MRLSHLVLFSTEHLLACFRVNLIQFGSSIICYQNLLTVTCDEVPAFVSDTLSPPRDLQACNLSAMGDEQ